MFRLSLTAGKFGFYLMSLVCIPLIVMMPDVLRLWLGRVPDNTVLFARLLILACMSEQITRGLVHANQAIGNIKWFSIIVSTMRMLALPVSWVFLHFGSPAWVAIFVFLVFETVGSFCRIIVLSKISDFCIKSFFNNVFVQIIPPSAIAFLFCYFVYPLKSGLLWMIVVATTSCLLYFLLAYAIGLTKEETKTLRLYCYNIINKFRCH